MINADLIDAADTLRAYDPVSRAMDRVATDMARQLDNEICRALCFHLRCDMILESSHAMLRGRGVFIQRPDRIQEFHFDGTPLLEIHPITSSRVGNVLTYTRNIKKLYGTEKKNPKERAAS